MKIISWKVINGYKLWWKLLFKTANILYNPKKIEDWVYKINVVFSWEKHAWVWASVAKKWVFEAHLFDFNWDLYNKKIDIYLLGKIRENIKFENFEDLKIQIKKDIDQAKNNEIKVMTFGTFDIIHPWHKYYLNHASFYWDKLITIIARDENVEKLKQKLPLHDEKTRLKNIKELKISDIVELWDLKKPLAWIQKYSPQIICLGYDQEWFYKKLKNNKNYLKIEIIRLKSYKPEIYKSSKLKNINF